MGENPITKTIKLKSDPDSSSYLKLETDGTVRVASINENNVEETDAIYKYSYDDKKETITMIVEKASYYVNYGEEEILLLTYDEAISKINEEYTVENFRKDRKKYYEKKQDDYWFKEDYPGCDTYDKYEAAIVKESGFDSVAALVEDEKQWNKNYYKALFSVKITYAYEIDGGKMTLIQKFTGIKNGSNCFFENESSYGYINFFNAYIRLANGRYEGYVDTDNKKINFKSRDEDEDGNVNIEKVNATYTEDIDAGTVTIKFKDKEYVCNFEGEKYTQVE